MRPIVLTPALLALIGWACAVLWIDGPASRPLAGLLAGGFAFSAGAVLLSGIDPDFAWQMLRLYERDVHPYLRR